MFHLGIKISKHAFLHKHFLFGEDEHKFKNQELWQDLNSEKPLMLFELACFF
jgi:hypothetical protein